MKIKHTDRYLVCTPDGYKPFSRNFKTIKTLL